MITRNNYELYIIDFYDGKLNKLQVEELHAFLEQQSDLKEEFELFSSASLEAETIVFADKSSLKKPESSDNEILIAYFENDLTSAEKKEVEHQLKANPIMAQELEIIKKTRLLPDYTILFADKSSLKRATKVISFSTSFYRNLSIAASVILIAIAYFIFRPQDDQKMMVDQNKKEVAPIQSVVPNNSLTPAPIANNTSVDKKENQNKILPLKHNRVTPSSNMANNKVISKDPNPANIDNKQSVFPENNLVIQQKVEEANSENVQQPTANNTEYPVNAEKKVSQVNDLSEIFSQAELKELGLAQNVMIDSKPTLNILNLAASKLRHFSETKEIGVVKKENYVDDATTYAVNVGENFSVSHTRRR